MNLGVFGYDFPHWKTQLGLSNLVLSGYQPNLILLQPWQELNLPESPFTRSAERVLFEPTVIAGRFDVPYWQGKHNSPEAQEQIQAYDLDVGVILGARILSQATINAFHVGVLNLHPGILPENRGLWNVEQAVLHGWEQGVTVHWIDARVDRGLILLQEEIPVSPEDSVTSLYQRLQQKEQELLFRVLPNIERRMVGGTHYNQPLTEDEIVRFPHEFREYKEARRV